jgi:hypothetical protein
MLAIRRRLRPRLNVFRLLRKSLNQPGSRRSRRRVGAINRLQGVEAAAPITKIQRLQAPGGEVIANDRLGHIAPTDARQEQGMLGPKIRQTPRPGADHAKIATFGQRRAIGEH